MAWPTNFMMPDSVPPVITHGMVILSSSPSAVALDIALSSPRLNTCGSYEVQHTEEVARMRWYVRCTRTRCCLSVSSSDFAPPVMEMITDGAGSRHDLFISVMTLRKSAMLVKSLTLTHRARSRLLAGNLIFPCSKPAYPSPPSMSCETHGDTKDCPGASCTTVVSWPAFC